jgi:hypothetical protein
MINKQPATMMMPQKVPMSNNNKGGQQFGTLSPVQPQAHEPEQIWMNQ